jgi:hypothetical protein
MADIVPCDGFVIGRAPVSSPSTVRSAVRTLFGICSFIA